MPFTISPTCRRRIITTRLYRWLKDEWRADAIVHVGKHGTLEWLPGKGVGLSEQCFPDALLADLPLFYPFIINDPGEGAQAKRRTHAVVVDHLTPPMTTADTYGALAQLTQLVDEYYQVEILDPAKLPLLQQQIWDLVKETNLDTDLQARLLHEHLSMNTMTVITIMVTNMSMMMTTMITTILMNIQTS